MDARIKSGRYIKSHAEEIKQFFTKVQNKFHYAIAHETAAEIIYHRADSEKKHMRLTS